MNAKIKNGLNVDKGHIWKDITDSMILDSYFDKQCREFKCINCGIKSFTHYTSNGHQLYSIVGIDV